ncbi:SMI1/KNR4 family protein [Streptomyces sp. OF3]|uniref:SMI1/KNR4 family protein n=1 Tax=Streptomyces alkaliterrae TaxID=2213162 RepID=A0A7W3ZPS7_9ACTN|nr:SMI1/KNR4 family protein [Streptomyces alkaliterrae]MBB1256048.1 SMI1/KNR4 family protein [Streptomyces alkaliterrae]
MRPTATRIADLARLATAFEPNTRTPPLGWREVRAFEEEHGLVLPEPYRTFVAEISDGCPSGPPHYGLIGLADLPPDWGTHRPPRELATPFPLTEAWHWDAEDHSLTDAELDEATHPVHNHGSVVLGTDGCGMYWHLVVTGPERGRIWFIASEGAEPFGSGFADWVAHWAAGRPWWPDEG